jgi:glutathione S-transferase
MPHTLWLVHGSHPCATVERALQLKGLPYRVRELPPPFHAAVLPALFGGRTVPAVRFEDGTKLQGSTAILRRLEELRPEPSLRLDDPRVAEAERWGSEVWQPVARRLLWPGLQRTPAAMSSFQEGSRLPGFPLPVLKALAPGAGWIERRLNGATDAAVRADLQALDVHLDRIDGWLADGTLAGAEAPNAADLQIAATTRLLLTVGDVRGRIDSRPAGEHARALFPHWPGDLPAGALAPWTG